MDNLPDCSISKHEFLWFLTGAFPVLQVNNFVGTKSENCRKFVPANRRPPNWKLYSSRLQAESYSGRHWPDRQHTIS